MTDNTAEKFEPTPETIRKNNLIKTDAGIWRYPPNSIERLAEAGEIGDAVKAGYRMEAASRFVNDYEAVYFLKRSCGTAKDKDVPTPFDRIVGVRRILSENDYSFLETVAVHGKNIEDFLRVFPILNKNRQTRNALITRLCKILDYVYEYYASL